jgi:uncharacterized protein YkwD
VGRRLCILAATLASALPATPALALTHQERSLVALINDVRHQSGVRSLAYDSTLDRAASAHTLDMLHRHYFAHGDFVHRLLSFGVVGHRVGENLAWGHGAYSDPRLIVRAWLASPEHRLVLLDRRYQRVGVGAATGPFAGWAEATVFTADFAG